MVGGKTGSAVRINLVSLVANHVRQSNCLHANPHQSATSYTYSDASCWLFAIKYLMANLPQDTDKLSG